MVLAQCPKLLEAVCRRVDSAFQSLQTDTREINITLVSRLCCDVKAQYLYLGSRLGYVDDLCLVQLLRGVCLRDQGKFSDAEQCFQDVISRSVSSRSSMLTNSN